MPITQPITLRRTDACFIIFDGKGQALAYVYFENEQGRRNAAGLMDEATALDVAKTVAAALRGAGGATSD
jgi:hypothetical protein